MRNYLRVEKWTRIISMFVLYLSVFSTVLLLGACSNATSQLTTSTVEDLSAFQNTSDSEMDNYSSPESASQITSEVVFNEASCAEYIDYITRFFSYPIASTNDLRYDHNLAFFLLHTAYMESNSGYLSPLEQNSDYFYLIPDKSLIYVAQQYLGLSDFDSNDLNKITEWPMGIDKNTGERQYSLESSLPYCDTIQNSINQDNQIITANVTVNNSLDETNSILTDLNYQFQIVEGSRGNTIYRLVSIE